MVDVAFFYFGNIEHDHFAGTSRSERLELGGRIPATRIETRRKARRWSRPCTTLLIANYGVDNGLVADNVARSL